MDLVSVVAALNPPATSGNDACKRVPGRRRAVLAAYRQWVASVPAAVAEGGSRPSEVVPGPRGSAWERERRAAWHELERWPLS